MDKSFQINYYSKKNTSFRILFEKSRKKDVNLARNNYAYEKRQRDLAKKKKKEDKRLRKLGQTADKTESEDENEVIEDSETDESDDVRND